MRQAIEEAIHAAVLVERLTIAVRLDAMGYPDLAREIASPSMVERGLHGSCGDVPRDIQLERWDP